MNLFDLWNCFGLWRKRSELIDGVVCCAINQWTPAGAPHNSLWELLAAQLPFHLFLAPPALGSGPPLHSVHSTCCSLSFIQTSKLFFIAEELTRRFILFIHFLLFCWFMNWLSLFVCLGGAITHFSSRSGAPPANQTQSSSFSTSLAASIPKVHFISFCLFSSSLTFAPLNVIHIPFISRKGAPTPSISISLSINLPIRKRRLMREKRLIGEGRLMLHGPHLFLQVS